MKKTTGAALDKYRKIFKCAPGLIVVSSTLEEGRLIEINDAFEVRFKCKKEEVLGLSAGNFNFWAEARDHARVVRTLRENGEVRDREIYFRDYTGNIFPGLYAGVIAEIDGEDCLLSVIMDISERKLAELRIRESEETLKSLMDVMPVGVRWYDMNGKIEYVNRSFVDLFGYTLAEIPTLDRWFSRAYPDPAYREGIIARWNAARDESERGTPIEPAESNVTCKDGSVRHVIVSTQFAGSRRLVIFTDVTERDATKDRLLNAQRLESLGILAGGIAHDFNNILTGIMGNISLARMFTDAPEKLGQLLDHAEQASRRAADLVSQLLTFAKGGAPVKKPLSVRPLVDESLSLALPGSKVRAVVDIPDSLPEIEADAGQLIQVFNNIIVNAVQAMPDGGTVTVSAATVELADRNRHALPGAEYVTLEFTDQGTGINERDLKRIFDPYFTTKPKGTGIGLSSAHSIVKKHGGHIDVRSTPGKGTSFTIYIPSAQETDPEKRGAQGAEALPARRGGSILVMDDESMVREIAAGMLSYLGYQVTTCATGEEAIALYQAAKEANHPFSAAIMDLTVPGAMGGKEAARQILEFDPSARLIVSSGYSNDPIVAQYASHGFRAALTKPYVSGELQHILSKALMA